MAELQSKLIVIRMVIHSLIISILLGLYYRDLTRRSYWALFRHKGCNNEKVGKHMKYGFQFSLAM